MSFAKKESPADFTLRDVEHEFAFGRVWNVVLHNSDVAIVVTERSDVCCCACSFVTKTEAVCAIQMLRFPDIAAVSFLMSA